MEKKPTYEELEERVRDLECKIDLYKQTEKELLAQTQSDRENECEESGFSSLDDDEEMQYLLADEKIRIMEAYEYYLSESSPITNTLNNAIGEFPVLEPILEKLLSHILGAMDSKFTEKEILIRLIDFLKIESDKL